MSPKYTITKSTFLGGWAVTSPTWIEDHGMGPVHLAEGTVVDSMPEALAWAEVHAAEQWIKFYESHTAAEPAY